MKRILVILVAFASMNLKAQESGDAHYVDSVCKILSGTVQAWQAEKGILSNEESCFLVLSEQILRGSVDLVGETHEVNGSLQYIDKDGPKVCYFHVKPGHQVSQRLLNHFNSPGFWQDIPKENSEQFVSSLLRESTQLVEHRCDFLGM